MSTETTDPVCQCGLPKSAHDVVLDDGRLVSYQDGASCLEYVPETRALQVGDVVSTAAEIGALPRHTVLIDPTCDLAAQNGVEGDDAWSLVGSWGSSTSAEMAAQADAGWLIVWLPDE